MKKPLEGGADSTYGLVMSGIPVALSDKQAANNDPGLSCFRGLKSIGSGIVFMSTSGCLPDGQEYCWNVSGPFGYFHELP
jgi:hypothetical protein